MAVMNKHEEVELEREDPKLEGDWCNVFLLSFTYILQCVPRGIATATPLILQERKVTYVDQAGFSLSQYPYCLKVLWSPIVDSVYSKRVGRRKTWVISTIFLLGLTLLFLSLNFDDWLGSVDGSRRPKPRALAIVLFVCILIGSTQDIAVDAWGITMLKKRNVGHQSSANCVGTFVGIFLGFQFFLCVGRKGFGNFLRSVPQDEPFILYSDFILFWSILCLITAILILLFKREQSPNIIGENGEGRLGILSSYKLLWQILKLGPVQKLSFIILSGQAAFGTEMNMCNLKLVDAGFSPNTLAILGLPSLPLMLPATFILSKHLSGRRSMRTYLTIYACRVITGFALAVYTFIAPLVKNPLDSSFPVWYYCIYVFLVNLESFLEYASWVTCGSFFSRISDPRYGGVYLALFSVVSQFASKWPATLCLWLVDRLTFRSCTGDDLQNVSACKVVFDGYFVEAISCSVIGLAWLLWAEKRIHQLEKLAPSAWQVENNPRVVREQVALTASS